MTSGVPLSRSVEGARIGAYALVAAAILAVTSTVVLGLLLSVPQGLIWGAVAVALTLLPLLVPLRYRRIAVGIAALVMLVGVGLSILSIGPYFVPSLALLVVSFVAYARST